MSGRLEHVAAWCDGEEPSGLEVLTADTLADLDAFLDRHARFDRYCETQDAGDET